MNGHNAATPAPPHRPPAGPPPMPPNEPLRDLRPFVVLLLTGTLVLAWRILAPFTHPIIFAIILASLLSPLQTRLELLYRGHKSMAALTITLLAAVAIVLPCMLFLSALVNEGVRSLATIRNWVDTGGADKLFDNPLLLDVTQWVQARLGRLAGPHLNLREQLMMASQKSAQALLDSGAGIVGNVATVAMQFSIMLFVLYFLVRDGRGMVAYIRRLSPLSDMQEDRIFDKMRAVSKSVMVGSFLTGMIQGVIGGLGFAMVGIPPLFWGAVMGFASLIPIVGTGLVWIPASAYMFIVGRWEAALFLSLWCAVLLGGVDNFVRPLLMRGKGGLSPLYIFLAVLGGVQAFGFVGLLYGPLIISLTAVILFTYDEVFHGPTQGTNPVDPMP
ncbi:MAG: AI-2E family transporter [Desulfovibrionaceae bacterium]